VGGIESDRSADPTRILDDAVALATAVADQVVDTLSHAVSRRGSASLVLSGGSTPRQALHRLARKEIDWNCVDIFWGDERCVPPGDEASNFRMAREALLGPAGIPSDRIHRIEGELGAVPGARRYEQLLRRRFSGRWPDFDVVLLGIGSDGHVASLFPEDAPEIVERCVVPMTRPHEVDRVSLSLGVLACAASLLVLASGAAKAGIVARAMAREDPSLPIVRLLEKEPELTWFLDRQAAAA
jgi:6-phosphogluconolactonase